jgi:hypothetical protein
MQQRLYDWTAVSHTIARIGARGIRRENRRYCKETATHKTNDLKREAQNPVKLNYFISPTS